MFLVYKCNYPVNIFRGLIYCIDGFRKHFLLKKAMIGITYLTYSHIQKSVQLVTSTVRVDIVKNNCICEQSMTLD